MTTDARAIATEAKLDALMVGRACGSFALAGQLGGIHERLSSLERHVDERIGDVHRRLDDLRTWLIALTALAGWQCATLVTLAIVVLRR
jgi:hypothetical protein